jgi:hypothetical protein
MASLSQPFSPSRSLTLFLARSRPALFPSFSLVLRSMILVVRRQGRDWAVAFDYRAEIPHFLPLASLGFHGWLLSAGLGQGQKPEHSSYRSGELACWLVIMGFTSYRQGWGLHNRTGHNIR